MTTSVLRFGIFAITSIALAAYLIFEVIGLSFDDRYELTAVFDDVTQLEVGDDVRVSGVPVGSVRGIEVVDGRAQVRLSVDRAVVLPADTTASVAWVDVVDLRAVRLEPGTAAASLEDGDRLDQTRSAVAIGALVDRLGPLTRVLDPGQLNHLVEAMVTTFDGNEDVIPRIVGDVTTMVETVAERDATVAAMIEDYAELLTMLDERETQIETLVDDLTTLTGTFAANVDVLDAATVEVGTFAGELHEVLAATEDDLGAAIDHLADVVAPLAERRESVDRTLAGLPRVLATLYEAGNEGDYLTFGAGCIHPDGPPCPYAMRPNPDDPFPVLTGVAQLLDLYLDGVLGRLFAVET